MWMTPHSIFDMLVASSSTLLQGKEKCFVCLILKFLIVYDLNF